MQVGEAYRKMKELTEKGTSEVKEVLRKSPKRTVRKGRSLRGRIRWFSHPDKDLNVCKQVRHFRYLNANLKGRVDLYYLIQTTCDQIRSEKLGKFQILEIRFRLELSIKFWTV